MSTLSSLRCPPQLSQNATGVVTIASTDRLLRDLPEPLPLLNEQEQRRAGAFVRAGDHDDFVAAHALVRWCARAVAGVPPTPDAVIQRCGRCGGPHGRSTLPARPDVHLSLSHSAGVVAAAAGPSPVGVDVARFRPDLVNRWNTSLALSAPETRMLAATRDPTWTFLLLWVRKEAMVKIGAVTLDRLSQVDLSALPVDRPVVPRRLRFGPLHFLELAQDDPPVAFAVASTAELRLADVADLGQLGPAPAAAGP